MEDRLRPIMSQQRSESSKHSLGGWTDAGSEETFESTTPVPGETVGEFTGSVRADPIIAPVSATNANGMLVQIHTEDSPAGFRRGTVESKRSKEVVGE